MAPGLKCCSQPGAEFLKWEKVSATKTSPQNECRPHCVIGFGSVALLPGEEHPFLVLGGKHIMVNFTLPQKQLGRIGNESLQNHKKFFELFFEASIFHLKKILLETKLSLTKKITLGFHLIS